MTPFYIDEEDWGPRYQAPRRALPKRDNGIAKVLEREQQPIALPVAKADAIVPVALLQQKLGKSAWRLWAFLLTIRNHKAEAHPSAKGMVKGTGLTLVQVEKALVRLRLFGLVADQGYIYKKVPCRCDKDMGAHVHKVYLRRVYGVLRTTEGPKGQTALVPRQAAQLAKEAAAHGGARAGAGRPKGCVDFTPRKSRKKTLPLESGKPEINSSGGAYKYQVPVSSEETYVSSSESDVSHRALPSETLSVKAERKNPLRHHAPILWCVFGSNQSSQNGEESDVVDLFQPKAAQPRPSTPAQGSAAPVPAVADGATCDLLAVVAGAQGPKMLEFGGGYTGPKQKFTPDDMRAASELTSVIEVLRTPAPPKVDLAAGEDDQVALLEAAYRAAHEKVLAKNHWHTGKGQTPKARDALLAAAQALAVEKISPTAWALFSFIQWASMKKKGAPSAAWVWSHQRIHEHAGWCRDEVGTINTAKPVPVRATTVLIKRLGVLRSQLGWGKPTADVVSAVLPDQVRRVLVAQQQQQREAAQLDIERRIRAGEWVWG